MNPFDDVQVDSSSWGYLNLINQDKEFINRVTPRTVSASAMVNPVDDLILVTATATLTLESAVGCDGRQHIFKNTGSGTMTIAGTPNIDGSATLATPVQNDIIIVKSNGVSWSLVFATGAGQIKFPATQNASTDPNTLDDYEEGTFTPADGSGAALTFTTPLGEYVKIGDFCCACASLTYPATGSAAGTQVTGFPFAIKNNNASRQGNLSYANTVNAAFFVMDAPNAAHGSFYTPAGVACSNAQLTGAVLLFQQVGPTA